MTTYLERYAELAKRLISTTGGEALFTLSPELQLGVELESDRAEYAALGGTKLLSFGSGVLAAGGAGHFNNVLLSSGSSGLLTVVTHIYAQTNAARIGLLNGSGFTGPVANAVRFRDARLRGSPGTTLFTKDQAAQQLGIGHMIIPAGVLIALAPFVQITGSLVAGGTILIENLTTNQTLEVYGFGYERNADPHEYDSTVS